MNTRKRNFSLLFIFISAILISCNSDSEEKEIPQLKMEFTKGEISISSKADTTNWKNVLPQDTSLVICFEARSLAIITDGEKRILLPKKDKSCYSYGEILSEFQRMDTEVMQDYFTYYLDAFKKKEKKEQEISAMVSRGSITMLYPDEFCPQWKDSITFSWKTELDENDFIIFELLNDSSKIIYGDTIPAKPFSHKVSRNKSSLENDADYYWRVYLNGTPSEEGMKFSIADSTTIEEIKDKLKKAKEVFGDYPAYIIDQAGFPKAKEVEVCWEN